MRTTLTTILLSLICIACDSREVSRDPDSSPDKVSRSITPEAGDTARSNSGPPSVRLAVRKSKWKMSDDPRFSVTITNHSNEKFITAAVGSVVLEVDSDFYHPKAWSRTGLVREYSVEKEEDYEFEIVASEFDLQGDVGVPNEAVDQPLSAGRHQIQVILVDTFRNGSAMMNLDPRTHREWILARSNPIELEIER